MHAWASARKSSAKSAERHTTKGVLGASASRRWPSNDSCSPLTSLPLARSAARRSLNLAFITWARRHARACRPSRARSKEEEEEEEEAEEEEVVVVVEEERHDEGEGGSEWVGEDEASWEGVPGGKEAAGWR